MFFTIGDRVNVLRACRLPKIEESLGIGTITKITPSITGSNLYWISGFDCAKTGRELRHAEVKTLAQVWAEQDEESR